ncbi:cytochrome P450 monooxygenase CYP63 [Clavulina sp. PMI_390]|nr:cytochrome P450 monooxygenase CYP63 [Clavulina sp. PMI_390]
MYYIFEAAKRNYRVYIAVVFLNLLVPPIALAALVSHFLLPQDLARTYHVLLYLLATPIYWTVRIQYGDWANQKVAKRLGAVVAPEARGKWPGNLDVLLRVAKIKQTSYASTEMDALFDEFGPDVHTVNFRVLWQDALLTRDHLVMKQVLATGFDDFVKGIPVRLKLYDLFGDGVFNTDGAEWKAHRALTRPFFARERITDFEHFDKYSNKVIDILRKRAEDGESIDLQDLFGRFTLDAAGEFLFGVPDFNTLDAPLPRPGQSTLGPKGSSPPEAESTPYTDFVNAFEGTLVAIFPRVFRGNLWPLWELFKNSTSEYNKTVNDWINPLVRRVMDAKKTKEKAVGQDGDDVNTASDEGSLLEHIAQSTDNEKLIRDELLNILLASRDTTACLLSFLFYLLSLHPGKLAKLREEILAEVPSGAPSYDDVRRLKYLRACLNETLRLFPPVPLNMKVNTRPALLRTSELNPDGSPKMIYVPYPETPIRYATILMQQRKDLWGSKATEFIPERWIERESVNEITADPFKFIAFNAGPRICLGQNFAYNEASFLVVRILQNFDSFQVRQREDAPAGCLPPKEWKEKPGHRQAVEELWPGTAATLYSRGGVWIKMKIATS